MHMKSPLVNQFLFWLLPLRLQMISLRQMRLVWLWSGSTEVRLQALLASELIISIGGKIQTVAYFYGQGSVAGDGHGCFENLMRSRGRLCASGRSTAPTGGLNHFKRVDAQACQPVSKGLDDYGVQCVSGHGFWYSMRGSTPTCEPL